MSGGLAGDRTLDAVSKSFSHLHTSALAHIEDFDVKDTSFLAGLDSNLVKPFGALYAGAYSNLQKTIPALCFLLHWSAMYSYWNRAVDLATSKCYQGTPPEPNGNTAQEDATRWEILLDSKKEECKSALATLKANVTVPPPTDPSFSAALLQTQAQRHRVVYTISYAVAFNLGERIPHWTTRRQVTSNPSSTSLSTAASGILDVFGCPGVTEASVGRLSFSVLISSEDKRLLNISRSYLRNALGDPNAAKALSQNLSNKQRFIVLQKRLMTQIRVAALLGMLPKLLSYEQLLAPSEEDPSAIKNVTNLLSWSIIDRAIKQHEEEQADRLTVINPLLLKAGKRQSANMVTGEAPRKQRLLLPKQSDVEHSTGILSGRLTNRQKRRYKLATNVALGVGW